MATFKKYAKYYDDLYQEKNYEAECDFLKKIFQRYSKKKILTILDLGCGTGNHDFVLGKRGYKVTGVDFSKEMVAIAKEKNKREKNKIDFLKGDIRKIDLKKKFDAVISMFAVVSYSTRNEDVASAFKTANRHLKKEGLFIFDCWSGQAVLYQKPEKRKKIIKKKDEKIIRFTSSFLDILNQTVDVSFRLLKTSKGKILDEVKEIHKMRFFFPQEIKYFLEKAGFKLLKICPFLELNKVPSENDWNITIIAEKI